MDKESLISAFREHKRSTDLDAQYCELTFIDGYQNYNRGALIIEGQYGRAEASPLARYYDDIHGSIAGAIDTVSQPWPDTVNDHIETNIMVTKDFDLTTLATDFSGTLKVKITELGDYERIASIRNQVGSKAKIRLDCNGLFDVESATGFIKMVSRYDIEFIEQPCRTNEDCARVNISTDIPIALDESARTLQDIKEISRLGAGDIIVLKVQPLGGLHKALEIAYEWGKDIVVASMIESQVGLDVGFALARSLEELNFACGLDNVVLEQRCEPVNSEV